MGNSTALLKLQQFDTELDKVAERIAVINSDLRDQSRLASAENINNAISTRLDSLNRDKKKLERDIEDLSRKMGAANKKIYGGVISNQKEFQAAEDEIRNIEEKTDHKENHLLEIMLECDKYGEGHKTSEKELNHIRSETEEKNLRLQQEKSDLGDLASTNTPIRDKARQACNSPDLSVYDRLRKSKKGIAISLIKSDLCSTCRVKIPYKHIEEVKSSDQFVHCNSCGRILCLNS